MRRIGNLALGSLLTALAMTQVVGQTVPDFPGVTDAEIQAPDAADWLSWRRTLDSWGYSPLDQINTGNVDQLRMVWAMPLNPGHQEGTPLVHDGIMYFPGPADTIYAVDARSGQQIWTYARDLPDDIGQILPVYDTTRNVALYGHLIIGNGADDYLYALDARTGELVWETQIMDYHNGAKVSAGPIIANGLAITGRSCQPEGGPQACVITAHDAETGEEVWRTSPIAQGDDPNDATWGDVPLEDRQQVGAWMIPSFDPELGLVYMGTSVSAPTPKIRLAGNDLDYLYHNSTLALDVETGEIVWHYQHLVDQWDMDHTFPRMLIDQQVAPDPSEVAWMAPDIEAGRTYRTLSGVPGKTGVIYTLDRETGRFLWARPTLYQNLVSHIDGATGRVTVNPETIPTEYGTSITICPGPTGGANYYAPAYSPLTQTMYFPLTNTCAEMSALDPAEGDTGTYGISTRAYLAPDVDGMLGAIHAVNAVTGRSEWTFHQRAGTQSLLTTGGGLLFGGDAEGHVFAMDQRTGEMLWNMNVGSSVTGYPATFAVDGQQYVAVSTGFWLSDNFTPEIRHGRQNTLFVFALPEAGIGHRGPEREQVNPAGAMGSADAPPPGGNIGGFSRAASSGVFTSAQAEAGLAIYQRSCAACHGANLQGAGGTAPLRGAAFMRGWRGRSVAELFATTRDTMPMGAAGSLSDTDYLAVTAYLLQQNDYPAGNTALEPDEALLAAIGID
ncbi:PQQ-binding-like beta-propeller repeat protein [Aurantiacibacter gilvus]|uniref:PQQ-binding-like beta-propeller repeat protein n=1 Tax=Aurantiacibacter gilvus TaxID=3139141 RepID=A0ABU9IG59_9SPHN